MAGVQPSRCACSSTDLEVQPAGIVVSFTSHASAMFHRFHSPITSPVKRRQQHQQHQHHQQHQLHDGRSVASSSSSDDGSTSTASRINAYPSVAPSSRLQSSGFDATAAKGKFMLGHEAAHKAALRKYDRGSGPGSVQGQVRAHAQFVGGSRAPARDASNNLVHCLLSNMPCSSN